MMSAKTTPSKTGCQIQRDALPTAGLLLLAAFFLASCKTALPEIPVYYPRPVLYPEQGRTVVQFDPGGSSQAFKMLPAVSAEGGSSETNEPGCLSDPENTFSSAGIYRLCRIPKEKKSSAGSTDKVYVLPVGSTLFIEKFESHSYEQEGRIVSQTANRVISRSILWFGHAKFFNEALIPESGKSLGECGLYPYSPDFEEQIKQCGDGLYIFLFPPWLRTKDLNGQLHLVADEVLNLGGQLSTRRFVYKSSDFPLKNPLLNLAFALHHFAEKISAAP